MTIPVANLPRFKTILEYESTNWNQFQDQIPNNFKPHPGDNISGKNSAISSTVELVNIAVAATIPTKRIDTRRVPIPQFLLDSTQAKYRVMCEYKRTSDLVLQNQSNQMKSRKKTQPIPRIKDGEINHPT